MIWAGCGAGPADLETTRVPVALSSSDTIDIVIRQADRTGLTYVNVHDDENTAVTAAVEILRMHGGRLVELRHSGDRVVRFAIGGTDYGFDPNRIFTAAGIDATLARHGVVSDTARAVTEAFAGTVLDVIGLDSLDLLVTVHNNGPDEYSVRSYVSGGAYERDARFVHIATGEDPDDFFFVTTPTLYARFRDGGFNVVMQDEALVTDDGSLSVLAARMGIPYVNVEAEHGHLAVQRRMLAYLHELFR